MKIILILLLSCFTFAASAQKVDFALSAGTGKSYIFESSSEAVNVIYGLPMSLMAEVKYTPMATSWGLKLRVHSIQSNVTGENWEDKTPLNGYVNSFTTSLLLENEVQRKNHSRGINFGLGLTKETLQPQQFNGFKKSASYASLTAGGHFTFNLNKSINFQILPTLLWQDPFRSIAVLTGSRKANLAGEDLTALINFGIRYKLSK